MDTDQLFKTQSSPLSLPNPLCIKSHLDQNHATAFGFNNVLAEKLANYIDDCAQLIQTKYEKNSYRPKSVTLLLVLCVGFEKPHPTRPMAACRDQTHVHFCGV